MKPQSEPPDHYGEQLAEASARFQPAGMAVSVSGSGVGRFLFAERGNRAIELSHYDAGWWVEFFADEQAVSDATFAAVGEAAQSAVEWLSALTSARP